MQKLLLTPVHEPSCNVNIPGTSSLSSYFPNELYKKRERERAREKETDFKGNLPIQNLAYHQNFNLEDITLQNVLQNANEVFVIQAGLERKQRKTSCETDLKKYVIVKVKSTLQVQGEHMQERLGAAWGQVPVQNSF